MQNMEGMLQKTPPVALGIQKNSEKISKTKPKIRIIHIFAPEIIKIDAANFRELVQRLTGKPTEDKQGPRNVADDSRILPKKMEMAMKNEFQGEEEIWRNSSTGTGLLGSFPDHLDGFLQEINQFPLMLPFEGSSSYQIDQLENGVI